MKRLLPFLRWFDGYTRADLTADVVSGVTVAMVLIPQSMAYAQLAGLPPFYGLYASFLPPMVAALFGSSRQLATGPVAMVSLMTAASLRPLATAGSSGYIAYAVALALVVGIFQLSLGVLRLGLVVNFLSHPVVNGFTNAAAIIIATSQLSKLFGVYVDEAEHHYETVLATLGAAWSGTHWPTLAVGVLAFAVMYGLKRINPRIPYVLVAVAVTTFLSWAGRLEQSRQVPLSAVSSPEVASLVRDYNGFATKLRELGDRRTDRTSALAETAKREGRQSIAAVRIRHEMEEIALEIADCKEQASVRRQALRSMRLVATPGVDGGEPRYYLAAAHPPDLALDGQTWIMRVGEDPIDESALGIRGGIAVVGRIPRGVPSPAIPRFSAQEFLMLLPYAVIISLLGFMEAISIAKAMAAKTGQVLDPNQELIGQGLANITGSLGQSYPTSGSFSRSAVNLQTGAVSGLSSLFTSVAVVITLLFLTPLLCHLPQATLAAIIMMAVIGLVSASSFVHSWRTHPVDGTIQVITFILTLAFAPHLDRGIMVGVALSIGVYLFKAMKPRVAQLSLHPDGSFRDAQHWGLAECRHVSMIRFDGPLFFANASYFEELVTGRLKAMPELRHILLVANGINDMDASGEAVLALMVDNVRAAGVSFSVSGIKEDVQAMLKRTHLYEKIGEDNMFPTQVMAVRRIWAEAHAGSDEDPCPLLAVVPAGRSDGKGGG